MANTIWFVSHRYAAPPAKDFVGNLCLWNCKENHHRKLIEWHGATVIDSNNAAHNEQDINFIGEWECSSNFVRNGGKGMFNRTHTPNYTQHDHEIVFMNTDPYVFGRKFYWSCCHHPKESRRVRRGDIVLFGSYTLVDRKVDKMVLDTVLMVDEVFDLTEKDFPRFTQCYQDVTLTRLKITDNSYMVVGKMYNPAQDFAANEPFSFVPCRREGMMTKFVLDIPAFEGKQLSFQQSGGHLVVNDAVAAFRQIVNLVRDAGCELGVYMPEPALTTSPVIEKQANQIISQQKKSHCPSKPKKCQDSGKDGC